MATPAQIAANRLNATESTGPRTEAGKAVSRLNALRHGVDAQSAVIAGEDPAELEALAKSYRDRLRPHTPEERFLVDTVIQSEWLRRRLLRIETEMTNHLLSEMEPCENPLGVLYCSNTPGARALERVRRHYEAADRSWFRALKEFDRLREQNAEDAFFGVGAPAAEENWVRSGDPAAEPAPEPMPLIALPAPAARDPHLALRL